MRVLVLGGGGREHALGWKLAQGANVTEVASAPGNPGLARLGPTYGFPTTAPEVVVEAAACYDLVVVGPEAPLAAGVVDALTAAGIAAFGPTAAGARLESSKAFAKEVMGRAGVATAAAAVFADPDRALRHLDSAVPPFVVKADGLAAGKGVLVTEDRPEAASWVSRCFEGDFGSAGATVVIEEYLDGPEVSVMAICAGDRVVPLAPARDYKRLLNGDQGPNTGGMGCYSPVPDLPAGLVDEVVAGVLEPTLRQMAADGIGYRGFLYAGMVLTDDGPKVLEFNCRLGDPETQVILPRLEDDLAALLASAADGVLPSGPLRWSDGAAVDVVLAAPGYPEAPHTGRPIHGLDAAAAIEGVHVFHAGTSLIGRRPVTAGGRVVNVVGTASDVAAARSRAYAAVDAIDFPGRQFRTDIATGAV